MVDARWWVKTVNLELPWAANSKRVVTQCVAVMSYEVRVLVAMSNGSELGVIRKSQREKPM